jgi:hypothetical protein
MTPAAKLTASSAVLLVRDVVKAANHYKEAMGFSYERFWGEPPSFVILHRDGMYLMLKEVDDPKHVVPHWTVSDKLWDVRRCRPSRRRRLSKAPWLVSGSAPLRIKFPGTGARGHRTITPRQLASK